MSKSFEVKEVHKRGITQDVFWTVVQVVDGEPLGGDHHWVERRFAENAKAAYERGDAAHGAPPHAVPYLNKEG